MSDSEESFDDLTDVFSAVRGGDGSTATIRDRQSPKNNVRKQVVVSNFKAVETEDEDGNKKVKRFPLSITDIVSDINHLTGEWPRSVSGQLFVHKHGSDKLDWLLTTDSVFGYLGEESGAPPKFATGMGLHTKGETVAQLTRRAISYRSAEVYPHEPPIRDHYYVCGAVRPGDGQALQHLLDQFSPATMIDRDLLMSMLATFIWGGPGGSRPMFVMTADEGRGSGKTTTIQMAAGVVGGVVETSSGEDICTLKTRLLSPDALTKRVILIDNLKASRFSSGDLEGLVTSPEISGRRLYVGEGARPNTLTMCVTVNGASFSEDFAQRAIVVKNKRPEYSGNWESDTRQFIEQNRQAIIADMVAFLRSPPTALVNYSRWGLWERDILSRLPEPNEAAAVIAERRKSVNTDCEETAMIEDFIGDRLKRLGYDIENDRVFIPSVVACRWLGWAMNEKVSTTKATQMLKQRIDDHSFKRLSLCPNRNYGRGFEYWGIHATSETYLQTDIQQQLTNKGDNSL